MPTSSDPAASAGLKILVVDDEKPVRLVAQRMLERLGHQVTVSTDTAEALACTAAPDCGLQLAFIDMHLGDEDGLQLAQTLCARLPGAPVVIMGGDIDDQARRTQAANPRLHLLAKPFSFADLTAVLARAMASVAPPAVRDGDSCLSRADSANIAAPNGR